MTLVITFGLPACSSDTDAPRRAAATSGSLEVHAEILSAEPAAFAAALPGYDVIAETGLGVMRFDARSTEVIALGDVGGVSSVAALSTDAIVLASSTGIWASDGHSLVPSPLAEVAEELDANAHPVLLAAPGPDGTDLWVASAAGLSLVRDDVLYDLAPAQIGEGRPSLAWGAPVGDRAVPWVGSDAGVVALVESGDGELEARRAGIDVEAESLAVDARGGLWALTEGELAHRSADARWSRLYLPGDVTALAGDAGSETIWVQTEEGIWRGRDGVFSSIVDPPAGRLASVDAAGRAIVIGLGGVTRISVGRTILLFGLEDGALLDHEATLEVVPSESAEVTSIEATLDGADVTFADASHLVLDPLTIEDGPHELAVTVHWGDSVETESLFFAVGSFEAPTWTRDVAPLFLDNCSRCHGSGGSAHRMDTLALWRSQFDTILDMVGSGRMPLPPNPPLAPEDVQLLRSWRAGGFPE